MKKIITALLAVLLLSACQQKNGSNPVDNNNNTNNNNNNTTTDTLKVTSYSPLNPYFEDEFTINGTGFDSDKSKDTVYFYSSFALGNLPATIITASSTQLKVNIPTDLNQYLSALQYYANFRVLTHGKNFDVTKIPLKRSLELLSLNDILLYRTANLPPRAGDSTHIRGSGFTLSGMTITIQGKQLSILAVDSSYWCDGYFNLPNNIFGEELDESVLDSFQVKITNKDGRTYTKNISFYTSPTMSVTGVSTPEQRYSLSELNSLGGVVNVTVTGKNLKADTKIEVAYGGNIISESNLAAEHFPDKVVFEVVPSEVGQYGVTLHRTTKDIPDGIYGGCSFTITN